MHHRKRNVNVFHGRGSTLGKMQRSDFRMEVHLLLSSSGCCCCCCAVDAFNVS